MYSKLCCDASLRLWHLTWKNVKALIYLDKMVNTNKTYKYTFGGSFPLLWPLGVSVCRLQVCEYVVNLSFLSWRDEFLLFCVLNCIRSGQKLPGLCSTSVQIFHLKVYPWIKKKKKIGLYFKIQKHTVNLQKTMSYCFLWSGLVREKRGVGTRYGH